MHVFPTEADCSDCWLKEFNNLFTQHYYYLMHNKAQYDLNLICFSLVLVLVAWYFWSVACLK